MAHDRLTRICFIDYDREMALVVDHKEPWTGAHEILGVGRLSKLRGTDEAEFALLSTTSTRAAGSAPSCSAACWRSPGTRRSPGSTAEILPDNREMQRVCEKLGFRLDRSIDEPIVRAAIDLASPRDAGRELSPDPLTSVRSDPRVSTVTQTSPVPGDSYSAVSLP